MGEFRGRHWAVVERTDVAGERGRHGPVLTRALLADGTVAQVQRLGLAELQEVRDLHEHLPDRERYLRFSSLHPADLDGYLRRLLDPGSGAVSLGARVRGRLVGVVQLVPVGPDTGEVAAAVHQDWVDHGVGSVLLEQLAVLAWDLGMRSLVADVLFENDRMMQLLADLGLPVEVTREGPDQHIEVRLHAGDRYQEEVQERHRGASAASLRPVLQPATVAVVGVRRETASIGSAVLRSLRAARFPGRLVAVHPHAERVDGVPCFPSISAVPHPVDLAVLAVPAPALEAALEDCGRHGVRAVVVLTAGVAAVPGLSRRMRELADRWSMRIVGPNTVGVIGPGGAGRLNATFADQVPPAGDIGLIAQSGGVALAVVSAWRGLGLGLSAMVATGEAVDVGARDALAWFDEDPGTRLVVLYAEEERDLRALAGTAAHVTARIPVLALRAGASAAGRRAVAAHHTGEEPSPGEQVPRPTLPESVTPEGAREAAFARGGIQQVDDLSTLAAAVGLLRGQPLPRPGTVAVLTNVGGGGVLVADACAEVGLDVAPLPGLLQARLRAVLPPLAATVNPVDTGPAVSPDAFSAALGLLLDSPAVGAVVTVTGHSAAGDPAPEVLRAVAAASGDGASPDGVPVLDVRPDRPTTLERLSLPGDVAGRFVVSVNDPAVAAGAMSVAWRRRAASRRPVEPPEPPSDVDQDTARRVAGEALSRTPEGTWLSPPEVTSVCAAAGLPIGQWGGPPVPAGDELLVGAGRDPSAGPLVVLGPGGPATDALGHRVHRLAPVGDAEVVEMLDGTGLFATAHGQRLDRPGVGECLRRVGWLVDAVSEIAEIEVNPLVVSPTEARALDVRVRVERS